MHVSPTLHSTGPGAGVCLTHLEIADLRNLAAAQLDAVPGVNLILGPNGAGKTSLLEAIHLLSRGRSFRPGRVDGLIRNGAERLRVRAEVAGTDGRRHRLGMERSPGLRVMRLDGAPETQVTALAAQLPVLVFEPHAHDLVEGGPEKRRRLLDWGLFHVEPAFLHHWRRYQRALRQRNAALRGADPRTARDWTPALIDHGQALHRMRVQYAGRLGAQLPALVATLAPALQPLGVHYRRGWPEATPLEAALRDAEGQDLRLGYTSVGPHRADLRLSLAGRLAARRLSRGQEKLVALALLLSQAGLFIRDTDHRPVLLLDDLSSEVDADHLRRAVAMIGALGAQMFVTALHWDESLSEPFAAVRRFHVEQGKIVSVV